MDAQDLATTATTRFNISQHAATEAVETYLAQIEALESRDINRDDIPTEDAEFVIDGIRHSLDDISANPLDAVASARQLLDSTTDELTHELHAAIRAAHKAGAQKIMIADAAGMSRPTIDKILGDA